MKSQRKSQRKGNRHMRLWRKQRHEDVPDVATSLRHIRAHFAALGYPLDEYTDEEIVAGIERVGRVVAPSQGTMGRAAGGRNAGRGAVARWGGLPRGGVKGVRRQ